MNRNDPPQSDVAMPHQTRPNRSQLSAPERAAMLASRQEIIADCLDTIQSSFFRLGVALGEIKTMKLYKADPLYPRWQDYIAHRLQPRLHQSTITDYMGIVKLQQAMPDELPESRLVTLGYKKAKLLKARWSNIQRIENAQERQRTADQFRDLLRNHASAIDQAPFPMLKQMLAFVPAQKSRPRRTQTAIGAGVTLKSQDASQTLTLNFESEDDYLVWKRRLAHDLALTPTPERDD